MSVIKIADRQKDGEKKPTRHFSSKQENRVAKEFGGRTTPNSGATRFSKGDVVLENCLVECKTKTSDSSQITIHKDWLEKLNSESLFMGKEFCALFFNFGPSDEKNYVIIDEETFENLINK